MLVIVLTQKSKRLPPVLVMMLGLRRKGQPPVPVIGLTLRRSGQVASRASYRADPDKKKAASSSQVWC